MGHPEFEEMRKKRGGDAASSRQVGGWCHAAHAAAGSSQCTKPGAEEEQ